MSEHSTEVIETKLDILIADFQEHRRSSVKHEEIARINGTLKMHSVIGAFLFAMISGYLLRSIIF